MNYVTSKGSSFAWPLISNLYFQMYNHFVINAYNWPPGNKKMTRAGMKLHEVINWNVEESKRIAESIREDL